MIALLFPGQGSQRAGMLRDVCEAVDSIDARALVDCACELVGRDLRAIDLASDGYRSTTNAQCALFVAGVACARALEARGVTADAMAGHSVGAFAAAVACGTLGFDDAMRIVDLRGRVMERAFPQGFTMGAIGGLDARAIDALVARVHAEAEPVFRANENASDQFAISGAVAAVDAVLAFARERGARSTRRLDVVVPAHSPLMALAEATIGDALASLPFAQPRAAYAANATARIVRDSEAIRSDLSSSISQPVRWASLTRALYERGTRLFIEARPGAILTDLARYAFPDARAIAMAEATLDSVVALAIRS